MIFGSGADKDARDYQIVRIPKSGSGFRSLYIAYGQYLTLLRSYLPVLHELSWVLDESGVNYAFVRGKNAVLNAERHKHARFALQFDLKDFFDSICIRHVDGLLPNRIIEDCFIDGAPRQGLPTSPLIATIAMYDFDAWLLKALNAGSEIVYSRYADDLTISFRDSSSANSIKAIVEGAVRRYGLSLNAEKTKLLDARNGRMIITGVGVGDWGVYPTRKTLKKLRAAVHQKNEFSELGLREWAACKRPKNE